MLSIYQGLTRISAPYLGFLLSRRLENGKEDKSRIDERKGHAKKERPAGQLCWIHAASVGEAQSALVFINRLLQSYPGLHIMITTGTKTSAELMEKRLPRNAFHQFYPLDHPEWTNQFLNHWKPDLVFWMESELWPNMLLGIQKRNIPTILINGRLSPSSYRMWLFFKKSAKQILSTFQMILTQTAQEAAYFDALGGQNIHTTDNLKFSSNALAVDKNDLKLFIAQLRGRPCWVYASTHKGEEELAARIHQRLKNAFPDLLTILVPRHPDRRENITRDLESYNLDITFRGKNKTAPEANTDIYIADTLGELGLFYRAAPVALIGRSFSDDGGGGHNPVEAAQLRCAVLYGPHVQNLQDIYDEMEEHNAALLIRDEAHLSETLEGLLNSPEKLEDRQSLAFEFAHSKSQVIETVMDHLQGLLDQTLILKEKAS